MGQLYQNLQYLDPMLAMLKWVLFIRKYLFGMFRRMC